MEKIATKDFDMLEQLVGDCMLLHIPFGGRFADLPEFKSIMRFVEQLLAEAREGAVRECIGELEEDAERYSKMSFDGNVSGSKEQMLTYHGAEVAINNVVSKLRTLAVKKEENEK